MVNGFVVESFLLLPYALNDGHRQWPSGIEGLPVSEPREPISLGASFIRQEGRSVADKPKRKK